MLLGETLSNWDLTLCFSMDPSTLLFLLKRNLHLMGLHPGVDQLAPKCYFPLLNPSHHLMPLSRKLHPLSFIASSLV
ncbi:hypothetical protein Scep_001154 [Stephania cephalantha]|uniref:Uncharacterized protein n=1 Tax=Stephania cephalantha TaxID=152367 RepID=A0AAP0L8T8_9MAGN